MRWLLRVEHSERNWGANPNTFGTAKLTRLEDCETPLNPQILYAVQIARARKAHRQSMSIIMGHCLDFVIKNTDAGRV